MDPLRGWYGSIERMVWIHWEDGMDPLRGWYGSIERMVWIYWEDGLDLFGSVHSPSLLCRIRGYSTGTVPVLIRFWPRSKATPSGLEATLPSLSSSWFLLYLGCYTAFTFEIAHYKGCYTAFTFEIETGRLGLEVDLSILICLLYADDKFLNFI